MHDLLKSPKKTKISLSDYNFEEDIQNRLILKNLDQKSLEVLEEILFSSLLFSFESLAENVDLSLEELHSIFEILSPLHLFNFDGVIVTVDKDKRKYFEVQLTRFEDDFKPNLDYFQNLLKCLPIEVLPNWYHVPRTSNNIINSLIEKHLLTPQIYQRYITELTSGDELFSKIGSQLFSTPELKIEVESILKEYNLSRKEFEEIALLLEYNMLAFTSFENGEEILTTFQEWKDYQSHLKKSAPSPVLGEVVPFRPYEYAFIQDMTNLVKLSDNCDLEVFYHREKDVWAPSSSAQTLIEAYIPVNKEYLIKLINKLLILGLALVEESFLKPTQAAAEWAEIPIAQRSHVTFKHPHNFIATQKNSPLATQRVIIEIQKSLSTIANLNWVFISDFIQSANIAVSEETQIALKKSGKTWAYFIPSYTQEEEEFIRYVICDWLFEAGITQIGSFHQQTVFRLTTLGKSILY